MKNWVSGKNSDIEFREEKKVKKLKTLNFEGKEFNIDKGNGRIFSNISRFKRGIIEYLFLVEYYIDRVFKKIVDIRKFFERVFDLGLLDNVIFLSFLKVFCKFKLKVCEVKCFFVGLILFFFFGVCKFDFVKYINKMFNVVFDDRFGRKILVGKCLGVYIKEILINLGDRKI